MADEQTAQPTSFKVSLADATTFRECIGTVNGLVSEANITLNGNGLEIIAMDPANVAMVVFNMRTAEFTDWQVESEVEIGVKLSDLKQCLGRATDKSTTLILELKNNKLLVILVGKNGKKKEFSLSLINNDAKKQKMPDLKFTADLMMENATLKDAIADVAIVAESIAFIVGNKKFSCSGTGDVNAVKSEVEAAVVTAEGVAFQSKYSIEYLDKFVSSKISKMVKVHFGKDYPAKFEYMNDKNTISLQFVLAPRIENN